MQRLRVELVEKRKQVTNDLQIDEIDKQIRKINLEIQNISRLAE
ncbi:MULTISPECIES: hypothetical protein [Psychrobacillus]|nr:hypothetical protein [Psychrobacillus psychrotolerans]